MTGSHIWTSLFLQLCSAGWMVHAVYTVRKATDAVGAIQAVVFILVAGLLHVWSIS